MRILDLKLLRYNLVVLTYPGVLFKERYITISGYTISHLRYTVEDMHGLKYVT